jgi:hypothetical protein
MCILVQVLSNKQKTESWNKIYRNSECSDLGYIKTWSSPRVSSRPLLFLIHINDLLGRNSLSEPTIFAEAPSVLILSKIFMISIVSINGLLLISWSYIYIEWVPLNLQRRIRHTAQEWLKRGILKRITWFTNL